MKNVLKNLLLATTFIAPVYANAQDVSGGITVGLGKSDLEGVPNDLNSLTFDGRIAVDIGSGLTFGARFSHFKLDIGSTPVSIDGQMIALDLKYAVSPNVSIGGFVENAEVGIDGLGAPIGLNISATTYGLEGKYTANALTFGGFVAVSDPGGLLPSSVDMRHLGLSMNYAPSNALTVGGSAMRTNIDMGGADIDVNYIGLAAVYEVTDSVNLFGGLSRTSISQADADVTTFGLGASYELGAATGVPMAVSLELARSNFSAGGLGNADLDTVRLGLSIPLGKKGAKAPLNSTADAILNPTHSAISQTVMNF